MTDATPAATLILFRDGAAGAEHLFVERAASMAFAGGATVFPGGRVDAGDRALAEGFAGDPDDMAARIAAIRETIEEAGVAIGVDGPLDADALTRLRAQLHAGIPFADALAGAHARVDPHALTPFARWQPNMKEVRVFDTRFYLARLPDGAPQASVDATENVRLFWAGAAEVLAMAKAGAVRIIFPTRRNLERLAMLGDYDAAVAQARAIAPDLIAPWIEDRNGVPHLCIPGNRGYPVCAEPLARAMRG